MCRQQLEPGARETSGRRNFNKLRAIRPPWRDDTVILGQRSRSTKRSRSLRSFLRGMGIHHVRQGTQPSAMSTVHGTHAYVNSLLPERGEISIMRSQARFGTLAHPERCVQVHRRLRKERLWVESLRAACMAKAHQRRSSWPSLPEQVTTARSAACRSRKSQSAS